MDQDLVKTLAGQGVFALLFGYLGHRQLKQYDRLQARWDEVGVKIVQVLDKMIERLEK